MTALILVLATLVEAGSEPAKPVVAEQLSAQINAGFPWFGLALKQPIKFGFRGSLESETALGRRWETRLGVLHDWNVGRAWRLSLGGGAGWVFQSPSVSRQGVQVFGRAGLSYRARWVPWLTLDYRTLMGLRERSIQSAQGTRHEWNVTPYNSLLAQLGVWVPVGRSWALGAQFIFGEIDDVFAIPGASLSLRWSAP